MIDEGITLSAGAGRRGRMRSLALTGALLIGFVGLLLFVALVLAPVVGAAGSCGGG
jgi:hypothetical protein